MGVGEVGRWVQAVLSMYRNKMRSVVSIHSRVYQVPITLYLL